MSGDRISAFTQPRHDRLAFVELRERFIGNIQRRGLVTRFGNQTTAASQHLAPCKEPAPGNIDNVKGKRHLPQGPDFQPFLAFRIDGVPT